MQTVIFTVIVGSIDIIGPIKLRWGIYREYMFDVSHIDNKQKLYTIINIITSGRQKCVKSTKYHKVTSMLKMQYSLLVPTWTPFDLFYKTIVGCLLIQCSIGTVKNIVLLRRYLKIWILFEASNICNWSKEKHC